MTMILENIYRLYPSQKSCIELLEKVYWNSVPVCPYCLSSKQTPMGKESRYHCNNCNISYSVTAGSIFNRTRIDLQKWFWVICRMYKNEDVPVRQLGRELQITKDSALHMITKINSGFKSERDCLEKIYHMISTENSNH